MTKICCELPLGHPVETRVQDLNFRRGRGRRSPVFGLPSVNVCEFAVLKCKVKKIAFLGRV